MAPIKFEEDIKNKLEERRIEPSSGSWDKLSSQLDKGPKGRQVKFWWLTIAASFVLVLVSILRITTSENEMAPVDQFSQEKSLDLDVKMGSEKEQEITSPKQLNTQQVVVDEQKEQLNTVRNAGEIELGFTTTIAKDEALSKAPNESGVSVEAKDLIQNEDTSQALSSNQIEESAIEELLSTDILKAKDLSRETDSLLKAAQKALLLERSMTADAVMVKASDLLMEVEDEVEPSLKSKVYDVFKGGFKKVKTAVAQRNN